jgi:O-antigen ligase
LLARERAVVLAAPALAIFLGWAAVEGGYPPIYWYPGALVVLALLAVAVAALPAWPALPRAAAVALACLAAYTVWSYCSIAWADVKADAWDGANRTLLYLTVYALFMLLPWSARGAHLVLGTYAVGVAAIAGWTLWRASTSAEPMAYFGGGRFSVPTTYHNANCALFTFAFVILVYLASRRATPVLLRGVAAAGSVVLTVVSLLAQSRGWLVAIALTALLFVAIVPGRTRVATALLAVGISVLPLVQKALDVGPAADVSEPGPALGAVARGTVAAAAAAGAFFLLWALGDRFYAPSARTARVLDRVVGVALAGGLALAAVLVLSLGSPRERATDAWQEFTDIDQPAQARTGPFLTSGVSGNRYDLWRVAFDAFRREPVTGIGADNFAVDYFRDRRTREEPRYPHSIELRALSQTGIVGAVLLAGFVAAAFAAAWSRSHGSAVGLRAAAVVGAAYWLIHGSIDWFWEIPATSAPVFAALGIAAGLGLPVEERPQGRSAARRLVAVAGAFALAAAAASLVFPLLSSLYVRNAARTWPADAPAAYAALDRARRLNPLSDRPDLVAGAIASRLGQPERMRRAFAAAVERNPHNWYGFLELGIAETLKGRRRQALAHLAVAAELNPLEQVIASVSRDVRARKRVDPREIDAIFVRRATGSAPAPRATGGSP